MTTSEKVSYLKGLFEGLSLDKESKEGKLFSVVIDILEDIALDIEDLEENALDLGEEIDELSDDLSVIEDLVYDDEDDGDDEDDEDGDYDVHGYCCGHDLEPLFYEVKCPECGNEITIDEDVFSLGAISCPNCNAPLELNGVDDQEEQED